MLKLTRFYKKRLYTILCLFLMACGGVLVCLTIFKENVLYFVKPADIDLKKDVHKKIRLGGVVKTNSVHQQGVTTEFILTDGIKDIPVGFKGILSDLFREGQGVIADGTLQDSGIFQATRVLAKHDEYYIPKKNEKKG